MNNLTIKTLEVAKSQLGVREATGHNDGATVEKYQKSVGAHKGDAWCMAFVYWCVSQAAVFYGIRNPLVKTPGVLRQLETTLCKRTTVPTAGSIFIIDFGKGLGHTGFVVSVVGDVIHTIEGNTNDDGSREGIGVFARVRKTNTIKAYILLA
jgi:hypothetical protein